MKGGRPKFRTLTPHQHTRHGFLSFASTAAAASGAFNCLSPRLRLRQPLDEPDTHRDAVPELGFRFAFGGAGADARRPVS